MIRIPLMALAVALVLFTSRADAGTWRLTSAGFDQAIAEQNRTDAPLLVYFKTEWCGYCRALDAEVLANKKVGQYLEPFAKVTINPEDSARDAALAARFGVKGYPAVFVLLAGREPVRVAASAGAGADAFIAAVRGVAGDPRPKEAAAVLPGPALPKGVPKEILDLQDEGRHEAAITRLTGELSGKSANPVLFFARAVSYRALQKHADAAEDLDAYLRKRPDDNSARELLARSYLNLTMYGDAAVELERLVKADPTADSHYLLAEADAKLGKSAAARTHYTEACRLGKKAACSAGR